MSSSNRTSDWSRFTEGKSVIDLFNTTATIIGLFWGIWIARWELNFRKATEHLGSICCDSERMGDFVPQLPSDWCRLWPFRLNRVRIPTAPTVTGLVRAGDRQLYSSSMFNWIQPNYDQVSWKPIYESFMKEIAWRTIHTPDSDLGLSGDIARYHNSAQKKVLSVLKDLGAYVETKSWNERLPLLPRNLDQPNLATKFCYQLCLDDDQVRNIDRHLLYEPWMLRGRNPSASPHYCTYLVNCVRPLKPLDAHSVSSPYLTEWENISIWAETSQALWIHEGKPCIEVSEEEIAASATILGMALSSSDWLPNGIGPFGLALSSEKAGCITTMRIVYGRRDLYYINAMGSGYSTLFAKHIACNCLPFAECSQEASVETIPITRAFLHKLKSGSAIADLPIGDPMSNAATRYLNSLPSSETNNYYKGFCPPEVLSRPGTIYNHGRQPISTWAEAVAGIAFGGLVPLAGMQLIQAVRFTVGGDEGLGRGNELLEKIINVVDKQTAQWLPGLHLFGRQEDYFGTFYKSALLLDFSLDETDYEVRSVVLRLDRYSTLIERLTAVYRGEGIDDAATRSKEVYERTCYEIQLYFNQALGRHNKQPPGPPELSPCERSTQYNLNSFQGSGKGGYLTNTRDTAIPPSGIGSVEQSEGSSVNDDLQGVLNLLSQNHPDRPLTAAHVAKVARCIIMMWTYIVGVVIWEKEDEEDAHEDALSPNRYKLVPFGDLPDVSAWR